MPRKKSKNNPDFESALSELETLVEKMEHGELSLEDSLDSFEQGIALTRHCQKALQNAEQKLQILTQAGDGANQDVIDDFKLSPSDNNKS